MIFLVLPPPFIQVTLVYIESIWPYIIGLSLIIFIIFDLISNPYANTISLYQNNNQRLSGNLSLTKSSSIFGSAYLTRFLSIRQWPVKLNNVLKIFGFSFLLSLTEQSCYFSFFGSLNLSSTGNFLDTYLFAASRSPIVLFFSCVGFFIGSFLAITIYNLVIAKMIFLMAWFGIKIKQYNPNFFLNWLSNYQRPRLDTGFNVFKRQWSVSSSKNLKNNRIFQIYTGIKNYITLKLHSLFSFVKSKDSLKFLLLKLKNTIQLFISYLPGGKRIIFFLFPGQAYSYKSDFSATSSKQWSKKPDFSDKIEKLPTAKDPFSPMGFKTESANAFLSIENQVESMLRTSEFNMSSSLSPSLFSQSSADSSINQPSVNTSTMGGSAFYNKIDKILLTCLITLSFTTIPYYSFDYIINNFFGFIPQDQILNAHSLRVNFPDYTNLLGITLSDNNSVINTDVSLYDRAHFMYGEWPNSFESLNYQGELMWTNLRDHRRQKRTRRSTRLKFKTLKTKISTSWKEFKRSSGFIGYTSPSSLDSNVQEDANRGSKNVNRNQLTTLSKAIPAETLKANQSSISTFNQDHNNQVQKSLRNTNNLSNLFYKIFSFRFHPTTSAGPDYSRANDLKRSRSKTLSPVSPINGIYPNQVVPKIPEEIRHSTTLGETIKPLSTSTFIDLSGGEKYIKTYPKNWKRVITEKYYQNPIYKTILSNDLKTFLKREPLTQQLTNNQENELYFLRVKMAHYYDSLRFYFTLKEQINSTRSKADLFFKSPSEKGFNQSRKAVISSFNESLPNRVDPRFKSGTRVPKNKLEPMITGVEESLKGPPFQFKSMTSMNYRQQFKGTLKTVKQLFAISLPESVPVSTNLQSEQGVASSLDINSGIQTNESTNRYQNKQIRDSGSINETGVPNRENNEAVASRFNFGYESAIQAINNNSNLGPVLENQSVEKSYKYDKYLFNEYAHPKNLFLHEEGRGLSNRKSNRSHIRESNDQNSTLSSTGKKESTFSNEAVTSGPRGFRGISLATKNIYNVFGSNDPFYVGWDQNLRKFVLTSRILSRSSALNYNTNNQRPSIYEDQKQRPLQGSNFYGDNSIRNSTGISNLTNPIKNKNDTEKSESSYHVPIYSDFTSRSDICKEIGIIRPPFPERKWGSKNSTKTVTCSDIKKGVTSEFQEKKPHLNQNGLHVYRPYTSWPFFKHELKNSPNRPYLVLYENYLNILNKRLHLFRNININDIDTKSLTFLYSYSFNNNVKKYVSQLPINIYKQSMRPSNLENLFTPTSNARSSFLWPGSTMPAWEYYFW